MELHFIRPYWFLALIPVALILWRLTKITLIDNWRAICDEHLLSHLLVLPSKQIKLPVILLSIGSLFAIFTLAGPSFEKQVQPIYRAMLGQVLVLNLSPSMADSVGTTKKIDRARFKLLDYLNRKSEGMTGLVVYTDEAHTISPLTEDNHTIANFVPALDPTIMPTFEDDTQKGLQEAEKLLKQSGINNGNVVLITDKITHFSEAEQVASALYAEGYRVFVLDVSDQPDTNNDMKKIAAAGGGKVISLTPNNHDIDDLIATTLFNKFIPPTKKTDEKGLFWQDNGRPFVFFIMPFALLAFRKGYL